MATTTLTLEREAKSVVSSSLAMKRKALTFNLRQYQERLAGFERQHGMTSQQFAVRFGGGELGDDPQWFEWEFVLDAQRETTRQLELLKSVRL